MIVGIDISKQTFDAAWLDAERYIARQYPYTAEGIKRLLEDTPAHSHYVMEATGSYHARLALQLYQAARVVTVVNPLVIKRFIQMKLSRVKSDKADAKYLCEYGNNHELTAWEPSSEAVQELQQAHSWLDDLIVERTRLCNRQEALIQQPVMSPFVAAQMHSQEDHLDEQISACEKHLEVTVKKHFPELYERLISVPCIGPKTAIELIVITDGFKRFKTIKALSAYVGISPTTYGSGTSVAGRGAIGKMGRGRLRQLLYVGSWQARRVNSGCRVLYDRLRDAGKPPKVISVAIAHKLLRQAFAVATKETIYSEKYA